jgi:hypothetical protein
MPTTAEKSLGGQHLLAPLGSTYHPDPLLQLGADGLLAIYDATSVTSNEFAFSNSYCSLHIAHAEVQRRFLGETAGGQQRNAENVFEHLHGRLSVCRFARSCIKAETVTDEA